MATLSFRPFLKKPTLVLVLILSLSLTFVFQVFGKETFATHPLLSSGYSSIKVFDREGRFVGRIPAEGRYWVSIAQIPKFLQDAVVAIEDARFYQHGGIDLKGITRALVKDVMKGEMAEGGSTITQQLIKNKYLSGEKTLDRKLTEARMAMEYERKYTKKQILEMYFNEIYYGNGAWGIAQAARLYYDKTPAQLSDAECALLAGVSKAPNRYNPRGEPAKVKSRRDLVLGRMLELKMITPKQKQTLSASPITGVKPGQAPWYLTHIRNKLVERYGAKIIEQGGLEVMAAMDLKLQALAEQTLREGVQKIAPDLQGALLCLDPQTGDVLAAAGGVDFKQSAYNRAFFAKRQPGSAIKPLIYAAAIDKGLTAAGLWNDDPVSYRRGDSQLWQPRNYNNERHGQVSLRQSLAYSNNIVAVKVLETIGAPWFADFAGSLGINLKARHDLSMALGTEEVTLNELVAAYAPLANGGLKVQPRTIIRIYNKKTQMWTQMPSVPTPVLSPATAFVTTRMLQDVMNYGTAKNLKQFAEQYPAAGKTGTTSDYRDAWFVGYTPNLITGVWVGHDKPKPGGPGFTGGRVSGPIWESFMRKALAGRQVPDFIQPETVVSLTIDPLTGMPATIECPQLKDEFFVLGTEPRDYCPEHPGEALQELPVALPIPGENEAEFDSLDPATEDETSLSSPDPTNGPVFFPQAGPFMLDPIIPEESGASNAEGEVGE
ncbi:MAG: PBP1A family penicillin-binding protein [Syntrophotaleaceae bacterium]